MAEQPQLNDVLLGEGVKQMQEISREEILRQIFGDIGELADDFTCAVESTVLLHGRMYITNRFICFYSNLFGLEKKIRIPYSHIRSITKGNTAMVIPNAIQICTDKKDYTFRSFWDREDCFRILTAFLNKFRGITTEKPAPSKLRGRERASTSATGMLPLPPTPAVDSSSADAHDAPAPMPASATLDEATIHSRHQSLPIMRKRTPETQIFGGPLSAPAVVVAASPPAPATAAATALSTAAAAGSGDQDAEFETDIVNDKSSSSAGADQATLFAAEIAKCAQKIAVVTGETLQVSLKDFADLVVVETAPYSFKWYHESVKDNSLVVTPWTEMPNGMGFGREIKFFKPVNLPGLASTRGVKLQKYRRFDDLGLIVCSSTRLEDVPCADSFSVEDTIVIRRVDANTVTVDISFCVLFLKSTMMKYIIERSTNVEMAKWLDVFYKHLKRITDLKSQGKLTYPNDSTPPGTAVASATPTAAASAPLPAVAAPAAAADAPMVPADTSTPTGTAKGKTGGGMVDGFLAVLSFKEESAGDQIKFGVCLLFVLYLVVNYIRWQMIAAKLEGLEGKLKALEGIAQQLLDQRGVGGAAAATAGRI